MADSNDDKGNRPGARPAIPPFRGPGTTPRPPLAPPAGAGGRPAFPPPAGGRARPATPAGPALSPRVTPAARPGPSRPETPPPMAAEPVAAEVAPETPRPPAPAPWDPVGHDVGAPGAREALPSIAEFALDSPTASAEIPAPVASDDAQAGDPRESQVTPPSLMGEVSDRALESSSAIQSWTTPPSATESPLAEEAGAPETAGAAPTSDIVATSEMVETPSGAGVVAVPPDESPAADAPADDAFGWGVPDEAPAAAPQAADEVEEKVGLYGNGAPDEGAPPMANDVISPNVATEPAIEIPHVTEEVSPPAVNALQDTFTHEVARRSLYGERAIYAPESAEDWRQSGAGGGRVKEERLARVLEALALRVRSGELAVGPLPEDAGDAAVLAAALAALLVRGDRA